MWKKGGNYWDGVTTDTKVKHKYKEEDKNEEGPLEEGRLG